MKMQNDDLSFLEDVLTSQFRLDAPRLSPVSGGADSSARNFRCDSPAGSYFVKVSQHLRSGSRVQQELSSRQLPGIVPMLKTSSGVGLVETDNGFVRVFQWIEGRNGFVTPLRPEHWSRVGQILRQVHENLSVNDMDLSCPFPEFSRSSLLELVDSVEELRGLLEKHRARFEVAVSTTHRLRMTCQSKQAERVVCHADIHVGNIMVDQEDQVWIVDWDDPKVAPRECDLIYFLDGGILGGSWIADDSSFLEGYGSVNADDELLAYYRYNRVLEDLLAYAQDAFVARTQADRAEACRMFEIQFLPQMPLAMAESVYDRVATTG